MDGVATRTRWSLDDGSGGWATPPPPSHRTSGPGRSHSAQHGRTLHVATTGRDDWEGTVDKPLRTISAAAREAWAGDVVTVHEGVYREYVSPPRGGESDERRIVFEAAPGEHVVIKGSEPVGGWTPVCHDTWKTVIPDAFFGDFNPYRDEIQGDWFWPLDRKLHTGAVYLDEHWLTEAAALEEVLMPVGAEPPWWRARTIDKRLMNLEWLRPKGGTVVPARSYRSSHGVTTSEVEREGLGPFEEGSWVGYEDVDFGDESRAIEVSAASDTDGGFIDVRRDGPNGELLGTVSVCSTEGWDIPESFTGRLKPVTGKVDICLVFRRKTWQEVAPAELRDAEYACWHSEVGELHTTIWAQFPGVDPNRSNVEINVRRSVFYPEHAGVNYITVRGFTMMHAATPWAPPTAEQIGLIGTHWSRGWIIEENTISHSVCGGITLGKYGDEWDNTSGDSAVGYVGTVERAAANGWNGDTVGHHVVRNNRVSHCEQAGVVGSLGAIFSTITGNTIHDIHNRRLFAGAEMAGIKIHAAVDTEISANHIYRTYRGIWLDWMTQGTRVHGNLLHDNGPREDLFVEVSHGPYVVDHNVMLSGRALCDWSQGGAYAHNLIAGSVHPEPELSRETPFLRPHTTGINGMASITGGDTRFCNNVFVSGNGLTRYDNLAEPIMAQGNLYLCGAGATDHETGPDVREEWDPRIRIRWDRSGAILELIMPGGIDRDRRLVTSRELGVTRVSSAPFRNADDSSVVLDGDALGTARNAAAPCAGPFEIAAPGVLRLRFS